MGKAELTAEYWSKMISQHYKQQLVQQYTKHAAQTMKDKIEIDLYKALLDEFDKT